MKQIAFIDLEAGSVERKYSVVSQQLNISWFLYNLGVHAEYDGAIKIVDKIQEDLVTNKSSWETVNNESILPQSISDGLLPGLLIIENTFFFDVKVDIKIFEIAVATSALSQSPARTSLVSKIIPLFSFWSSFNNFAKSKLVNGAPTSRPGLTITASKPSSSDMLRDSKSWMIYNVRERDICKQ